MNPEEGLHESLLGARAHREKRRLRTFGAREVSMTHVRIQVDAFARFEDDRVIEFSVDCHRTLENENKLLARMLREWAEFLHGLRSCDTQHRDHALASQLGAQIPVVVMLCIDAHKLAAP